MKPKAVVRPKLLVGELRTDSVQAGLPSTSPPTPVTGEAHATQGNNIIVDVLFATEEPSPGGYRWQSEGKQL